MEFIYGYFDRRNKYLEERKNDEVMLRRFCNSVYKNKSLVVEEGELEKFEEMRKNEANDYHFRKKLFWPLFGLSVLLFDQSYSLRTTSTNKPRIAINLLFGVPFSAIFWSGVVFYKESFESHKYAIMLCEKYKSCDEDVESSNL